MSELEPEVIWLILGMLLILSEFLLPGLIAAFFGAGALVVGLLIWAGMPAGGPLPFVVFSVVSIGALLLLRSRFKPWFAGRSLGVRSTGPDDDFVGHQARVIDGFSPDSGGFGRVSYRDAPWKAQVREMPEDGHLEAGDRVTIVDRSGSILTVRRS